MSLSIGPAVPVILFLGILRCSLVSRGESFGKRFRRGWSKQHWLTGRENVVPDAESPKVLLETCQATEITYT